MHSQLSKSPVEVLLVDDEPQAGKYFQKAFGAKFDIYVATSAEEAEHILFETENSIGIVISDQRMPGRSGVSLLTTVRERKPEIIRMLTSAYSDLDSAIDAVNRGEIMRYITKPWDLVALGADLDQAATMFILHREYDALIREKLTAVQRTLLRDRVNNIAAISAGLGTYRNAKASIYEYLKDQLSESCFRMAVNSRWQKMKPEDHWRLPLDESQRLVSVADELVKKAPASETEMQTDVLPLLAECASALTAAHRMMSVSVHTDERCLPVAGAPEELRDIIESMMRPICQWAAPGSTVVVQATKDKSAPDQALISFEVRNVDPAKVAEHSLIHATPLEATPAAAVDYLRAVLAVGHRGGTVLSPPAQNGFKQVNVTLKAKPQAINNAYLPSDWLLDLNEESERWVMENMSLAS